jgi:signal peptidase II
MNPLRRILPVLSGHTSYTPRMYSRPIPKDTQYQRRLRFGLVLVLGVCVLGIDQFSKSLVAHALSDGRIIRLAGGLLWLDYSRNTGAAFSILPHGGAVFAAAAVVVCIAIVLAHRLVAAASLPVRLGLGFVLGGALGNLLDRVRLGYVVDFIDVRWWPVFNVADSAIVVGVCILALHTLAEERKAK